MIFDCEYECSTFWGDTCMPQKWVRDGIIDCEDGSDEDEATCGEDTVPEPWDYWAGCTDEDHACSSVFGEECIPPHWVCDHIIECEDARRKATALKVRNARVKARAEISAKLPVE